MTQWTITIIILLLAAGYALRKLVRILQKPAPKADDPCGGCSSDCGGCQHINLDKFSDKIK